MRITSRLLPDEEWAEKLAGRPPFDQIGLPPVEWLIPVVEVDGRVVASCALFGSNHWDGFAIDPEWQKHPVIAEALIRLSIETLQRLGVTGVHCTVPEGRPDIQALVEHFGFVKAPGTLYLLSLPPG